MKNVKSKKVGRYHLKLINRNGYIIEREFNTIEACKEFSKFYPLDVFFGWIYDSKADEMKCQNNYTTKWENVTNESFEPYY